MFRICLLVPVALSVAACHERGQPNNLTSESRAELLRAFGSCATTGAQDFDARAAALQTATAALVSAPGDAPLAAARAAFVEAMASWQVSEGLRFGPAAPRSFPGGQDFRDHIYSWPLVSRCAVEETIVSKGYESPSFANALANRRGLATLEYLLFYEGTDTACPSSSSIVSTGSWGGLGATELASRKRAYAAAAAAELRQRAAGLLNAWVPVGGSFQETLGTAGAGSAVFSTSQSALNAVSDALFYLEHEVKDLKLATPMGLRDCPSPTCPAQLESRYAHLAKRNVAANLTGFRRLAEGCEAAFGGLGFDDLLESVGASGVAQHLRDGDAAAQTALDAIDEPDLDETLASDRPSLQALYDQFKNLSDLLKTELVTVLDLEIPLALEGDND